MAAGVSMRCFGSLTILETAGGLHTPFLCREEGPSQPPSGKITTPTATALMSRRTFPNPVSSSYGGAVSKYVAGAPYR